MKTEALKKKLREGGAYLVRQGRGHEVWKGRNGAVTTVPRHTYTNDHTAKGILKDLGLL